MKLESHLSHIRFSDSLFPPLLFFSPAKSAIFVNRRALHKNGWFCWRKKNRMCRCMQKKFQILEIFYLTKVYFKFFKKKNMINISIKKVGYYLKLFWNVSWYFFCLLNFWMNSESEISEYKLLSQREQNEPQNCNNDVVYVRKKERSNTIWFWFDLIRFWKDFSVCAWLSANHTKLSPFSGSSFNPSKTAMTSYTLEKREMFFHFPLDNYNIIALLQQK